MGMWIQKDEASKCLEPKPEAAEELVILNFVSPVSQNIWSYLIPFSVLIQKISGSLAGPFSFQWKPLLGDIPSPNPASWSRIPWILFQYQWMVFFGDHLKPEPIHFPMKLIGFSCKMFPLNQSIDDMFGVFRFCFTKTSNDMTTQMDPIWMMSLEALRTFMCSTFCPRVWWPWTRGSSAVEPCGGRILCCRMSIWSTRWGASLWPTWKSCA